MWNKDVIMGWYKKLRDTYGAPQGQWTLWCKRPKTDEEREQVIMETILTQRTNWRNVERAVVALKKARLLSLGAFLNAYRKNPARTALLIKSSGFYQQKAARIAGLAGFIKKRYGTVTAMKKAELMRLRAELILLHGIGPETADSILLYALDKPIFVIDEYTRRFFQRRSPLKPWLALLPPLASLASGGKLWPSLDSSRRGGRNGQKIEMSTTRKGYDTPQQFFQKNLKKDYRLYQDFHALIVIDAKESHSA